MTVANSVSSQFFVAGGTLRRDASSYVARGADDDLFNGLAEGIFCYVLTSRQMGKSSLMVRTASRLRDAGESVVVLDLTAIGQNLTAEQWYDGLLERVGSQLDLEDELEEFWLRNTQLGPLRRWMRALEEVVIARASGRVTLFVDEIDAVRSLPFSTDEFFAGIRELYNRRTETPELERLTFCLLGVASPSDLIRDTRTTPFNIGRRIELGDFKRAEVGPLAAGLSRDPEQGREMLDRVLHWTGGHPYLTQRLCREVVETGDAVDVACERLFLSRRARDRDDNLLFVRERLLRSEADLTSLLELFDRVRAGKRVDDDETNPLVSVLNLTGVTRVRDGRLLVRNRIYRDVFDRSWIREAMPEADVRRQRAAYRRGILRATTVALVALTAIAALAVAAFMQRNEAQKQRQLYRRLLYASQMNLAQQAWDAANAPRVVDVLSGLDPAASESDLRGWEWHYLWQLAHRERIVNSLDSVPWFVVVSPDSSRYVTAGGTGDVTVFDARDGHEVLKFATGEQTVRMIVCSPDGRLFATSGTEDVVRLWDAATGTEIRVLPGHPDGARSLAFSPDGRTLATGGRDRIAKFWDVATGAEVRRFEGHADTVGAVAFSPDGRRFATAGYDGKIMLWDAATGRREAELSGHPGTQIWSAAFSPDGRLLATGGWDNTARLWDVASHTEVATLRGHADLVTMVAFSPDGRTLATASYDMTVRMWDVASHVQAGVVVGHTGFILGVAYAPDGSFMVTGGRDQTARVWDAAPPRDYQTIDGSRDSIWAAAFSPDGRLLATGDGSRPPLPDRGQVRLWDAATGRPVATLDGPTAAVRAVAFSPDGATLVTGGADNVVRLWDTATWTERASIRDLPEAVMSATYSRDGRLLVFSTGQQVVVCDAGSLERLGTFEGSESNVWNVAVSPDSKLIAAAGSDGWVRMWDRATGRQIAASNAHKDAVFKVAFSPDGSLLASSSNDGVVKLWEPATLAEVATLKGHRGWVWGLTFSPDGRRLATGSLDATVKLWDVETRQEVSTFHGHTGLVTSVLFSPDGSTLASTGSGPSDRFVHIRRAR